ncbi:MAG TPA: CPBP family intramembrane metalloprotease [Anaerolineae bacterium]|nr:CPBP family intramembrane metalloprotease [Anaerolineae bacterium]
MSTTEREFTIGSVTFNVKLTLMVILTTVVPMLDAYDHTFFGIKAYDRVVFYLLIPMLVILLIFRQPPRDFGFQLGNWREGLRWVIAIWLIMGIFLYFFARTSGMQTYYATRSPLQPAIIIWRTCIELFSWEFIWRGFLLFGLARYVGAGPAIFLQAVPFAYMHLGKPEIEALSTIFGGAGFGFFAWRTKSFIYPWLIHWFMAAFTALIAIGAI